MGGGLPPLGEEGGEDARSSHTRVTGPAAKAAVPFILEVGLGPPLAMQRAAELGEFGRPISLRFGVLTIDARFTLSEVVLPTVGALPVPWLKGDPARRPARNRSLGGRSLRSAEEGGRRPEGARARHRSAREERTRVREVLIDTIKRGGPSALRAAKGGKR